MRLHVLEGVGWNMCHMHYLNAICTAVALPRAQCHMHYRGKTLDTPPLSPNAIGMLPPVSSSLAWVGCPGQGS